jgi:hypothetical protein
MIWDGAVAENQGEAAVPITQGGHYVVKVGSNPHGVTAIIIIVFMSGGRRRLHTWEAGGRFVRHITRVISTVFP